MINKCKLYSPFSNLYSRTMLSVSLIAKETIEITERGNEGSFYVYLANYIYILGMI